MSICKLSEWGFKPTELSEGDIFSFIMPGFCSGEYRYKVEVENDEYILRDCPSKIFEVNDYCHTKIQFQLKFLKDKEEKAQIELTKIYNTIRDFFYSRDDKKTFFEFVSFYEKNMLHLDEPKQQ